MSIKYKINSHLSLTQFGNTYHVKHGAISSKNSVIRNDVLWVVRTEWEGELIDYSFRNLVPHSFNGHFNTLEYDKQIKVLELYKRFN